MLAAITPPGSTLSRCRSRKYHHGMPFIAPTTDAEGDSAEPIFWATGGMLCALSVMNTTLAPAMAAMSPLHRGEVRTPRDEDHVLAAARQVRSEQAADRAGADDRDGHGRGFNSSATDRRWILPVAVRGICSTM